MRLVSSFGSIYRIPDQEYINQLLSVINGNGYRLRPSGYLGEVECNLTDLTADEANALLDEYNEAHRRGPRTKLKKEREDNSPKLSQRYR